jgi:cell wall-associated NlpC family hydrolase
MIHDLEDIAARWRGTPFSANACVPGPQGGVSCQALAAAIYIELGVLPADAEIPAGRINRGRFSKESEITPWIDGRFEFQRQPDLADVQPGDLLGFQIGHCVNHCGVALPGGQFIHCLERAGVNVSSLQDATWLQRLAVRWSPRGGIQ